MLVLRINFKILSNIHNYSIYASILKNVSLELSKESFKFNFENFIIFYFIIFLKNRISYNKIIN